MSEIPTDVLERDLKDSIEDIRNCEKALNVGLTTYSGGSIKDRRDDNIGFVHKIEQELKLRAI